MSIQIFACDHRKNIQWNLPYIRLGNFQSDAVFNINNDVEICPYQLLLSEGAQIWYVWKHIQEFGNPKYIGFCHYRRFFGNSQMPIDDMPENKLDINRIFSPIQQLQIMLHNNFDGLVPVKLCPLPKSSKYNYNDIVQQTKMISDHDGLGFTTEVVNMAFSILMRNTPSSLRLALEHSMKNDHIYVCNIFTMKSQLFKTYGEVVFKSISQLYGFCKTIDTSKFHKRWMGYILERFTSLIIQSFELDGAKFGNIPLLTLDGWKHETFEKHIGI